MPVLKVALHGKRFYKSHVHTTQGNLKTQSSSVILDFCLSKNRAEKYTNVNVFEKLCFQNVFRLHRNAKPVFSNSSGLKSVFKKDPCSWRISVDGSLNRRNKATVEGDKDAVGLVSCHTTVIRFGIQPDLI